MKKIMIATDGSEYSQHAAEFLARLPHAEELEMTVASVVNTPRVYTNGSQAQWLSDYVGELKHQASEGFEQIQQIFAGANVHLHHEVIQGPVGPTLVDLAKQVEADLVVMGARGHSNVERILLGSISDFVATHAHCSVLVVRPAVGDGDQVQRILLGYEDSGPAEAAVEEIREIQWGPQSELHVVSVVPPLRGFVGESDVDAQRQTDAQAAVCHAASELKETCGHIRTHVVDHRHVGEGLVNFAEDQACDLVVVGETERSVLGRLLMGSVSRYVLRHAPCSVWITRRGTTADTGQRVASETR